MRKIILTLIILFSFISVGYAQITTIAYVTADDVTIDTLESNRVTLTNAINSSDGSLLQAGSITSAKLDANANPENRWNEGFNDFVFSGLTIPTSTSLSSTTTSGIAYVNGVRVVKDATAKTYTASKQTWVDLSDNGTFTYQEVTIGESEPSTATDSIRLARVSTDTTKVLSVSDERVTEISIAAGSAGSLADTDADTGIQTEESDDEDILRFDIGDTTLTTATEALTIQAINATTIKIEPGTDNIVDLGSSSKEFRDLYIDGTITADSLTLGSNGITMTSIVTDDTVTNDSATSLITQSYTFDKLVRAWINFNGTNTIAINNSFNVSGITDRGTGEYTITWDTDFADANYCVTGMCRTQGMVAIDDNEDGTGVTASDLDIYAILHSGGSFDPAIVCVMAIGDQ